MRCIDYDKSRRFLAHPGELVAAERFAYQAQEDLLRRGNAWVEGSASPNSETRIIVHTDITGFTYSQPRVLPVRRGMLLNQVPVTV